MGSRKSGLALRRSRYRARERGNAKVSPPRARARARACALPDSLKGRWKIKHK